MRAMLKMNINFGDFNSRIRRRDYCFVLSSICLLSVPTNETCYQKRGGLDYYRLDF